MVLNEQWEDGVELAHATLAGLAVYFFSVQRWLLRALLVVFVLGGVLGFAVLTYAAFYLYYIPHIAHAQPVHFQFQNDANPAYALVPLTSQGKTSSFLAAGQPYDVSIHLKVPESDVNYNLGNFMLGMHMMAADNSTISISSRPLILKYRTPLLRLLSTFVYSLPLIFDVTGESQNLQLIMFEGLVDNARKPIHHCIATLSDSRVQVYGARVHLDARFSGMRYLMYYWFWTSAALGVAFISFLELSILSGMYLRHVMKQPAVEGPQLDQALPNVQEPLPAVSGALAESLIVPHRLKTD